MARRAYDDLHLTGPVVVETGPWGVSARPATRWERLLSRLRAARLDEMLARGARPESSPILSLRASRLARWKTRRELASAIGTLLNEADERPVRRNPSLARLQSVRAVRGDLAELVDMLVAPAPVAACGVAQVELLLTDGHGPLYVDGQVRSLQARVRRAIEALDPDESWGDWPSAA
jgi:hypothetical protein